MSGSIIPTPTYKATDWQSFGTQVEKQRLGFIALSLTNYDNDSEPQIVAGSVVEISGSLFQFSSNDSVSGTPVTDSINYIMLEVSGSGDSQTVSGSWTTTAPTWNDAKQGWYDATGNKRYVAGCIYDGTYYNHKFLFDKHRDRLRDFTIEIGDWNMDSSTGLAVNHKLGNLYKNVRAIQIIVRDDADSVYSNLNGSTSVGNTTGGTSTSGITSTQIYLVRTASGMYDNANYNSTSYNRGWITVTVDIII